MKTFNKKVAVALTAIMFIVVSAAGMAMAADTVTGTVTTKDERIVLNAADGSYILEGDIVSAEMVGKKVSLTGTLAEKENAKVFTVLTMKEVTE